MFFSVVGFALFFHHVNSTEHAYRFFSTLWLLSTVSYIMLTAEARWSGFYRKVNAEVRSLKEPYSVAAWHRTGLDRTGLDSSTTP